MYIWLYLYKETTIWERERRREQAVLLKPREREEKVCSLFSFSLDIDEKNKGNLWIITQLKTNELLKDNFTLKYISICHHLVYTHATEGLRVIYYQITKMILSWTYTERIAHSAHHSIMSVCLYLKAKLIRGNYPMTFVQAGLCSNDNCCYYY